MGIDAVFTWVDGNDPVYLKRKQEHLLSREVYSESELVTGRDSTRFTDNGELRYAVLSLLEYAPWIDKIFIVTDQQAPPYFSDRFMVDHRISIIDHREIFRGYEWALPTYNNRSIETALWRIPELSEQFIYFNDDFILTQKVTPEHFFRNGSVVLRGDWKRMQTYGSIRILINRVFSKLVRSLFKITRSLHHLQQIKSARKAGFKKRYFRFPHVPHPLRKSTIERFFSDNPDSFEENIRYRIRDVQQFSSIFLSHYLEILGGTAILSDTRGIYMLNGETDFNYNLRKKINKIRQSKCTFLSLQGFEKFSESNKSEIEALLSEMIPSRSEISKRNENLQ